MRRRFGAPPFRRQPPGVGIAPALQHAHQLLEAGEYPAAALAFEQLAQGAELRQGPRAPFFFLQAGRARLYNQETNLALTHFRHGLESLERAGRRAQLQHAGRLVQEELSRHGLEAAASSLAIFFGSEPEPPPVFSSTTLPTHCPSCGGPLRPSELEWLDAQTAECPYCGSPLRAG
jgi:hypothetical protein